MRQQFTQQFFVAGWRRIRREAQKSRPGAAMGAMDGLALGQTLIGPNIPVLISASQTFFIPCPVS